MTTKDHSFKFKGGRIGVLLVHGLCGTPSEMRFVATGLVRAGYTVHCPQLAGHGGSMDALKATTWQDWYQTAETALIELRKECDTVIVGGLSTGALLGLLLAARHPDKVSGLTMYAPTFWLNGWLIPWYARAFKIIRWKRLANMIGFPNLHPHGIKDDRVRQFILQSLPSEDGKPAQFPATPGGVVLEHRNLMKEVMRSIGAISQPALIIHPREDNFADLNNAMHLQRNLKGSVEMTVLDDSYHIVTVDRQRNVVLERTITFLDRLTGGTKTVKPSSKLTAVPAPALAA
ncbi:MAG: alpha/beta fold hydrolase [Hyphomicrobiaceae bacterium]|nr:alpha/beta fold hydrolase [Hyphomicrobiaceae bacterium]